MAEIIETHAHIYAEEFDVDRDECIARALENGVSKILMPNVNSESIERILQCEQQYESCIAQMGLHPCYVKEDYKAELAIVEEWLSKRDFIAIGEIGLDYYWDKTFIEEQKDAFRTQITWAIEKNIPIVIHARDSTSDVIEILKEMKHPQLRGVFHCFGGTTEEAHTIIEQGFKLGIGGVSTFKKANMKEVLPEVALQDIVLETDCPYLAPVPYRGKRNEVSYLSVIAQHVADIYQMDYAQFCLTTSTTAKALFQI